MVWLDADGRERKHPVSDLFDGAASFPLLDHPDNASIDQSVLDASGHRGSDADGLVIAGYLGSKRPRARGT